MQVLIDAGFAVFVVPSRQIKALRTAPDLGGVEAEAHGQTTIGLVAAIGTPTTESVRIEAQIGKLFDAYPEQKIFAGLLLSTAVAVVPELERPRGRRVREVHRAADQ